MAWSEIWTRVLRLPNGRRSGADALSAGVLLAAALLAAPMSAEAASWRVSPSESRLSFGYTEDGKRAEGGFKTFTGAGEFDEKKPEAARLSFEIRVASIRLADSFRNEFVQTEAWFNTDAHPTARYTLVSLKPLGGDRYRAVGRLTIKGRTQEIASDLTLTVNGSVARAKGRVSFDRLTFRLGDRFSLFVKISDTVDVSFDLVARRR